MAENVALGERARGRMHRYRIDSINNTIQEAVPPICMYALTSRSRAAADRSVRPPLYRPSRSDDHYRSVARFIGDDASSARRENLITFYDSVPLDSTADRISIAVRLAAFHWIGWSYNVKCDK